MNTMKSIFQSAVENIKQQHEAQKQQSAAQRDWVNRHPATKVICDFFQNYYAKHQVGYNFLKENRLSVWLKVKENGIEVSWTPGMGGLNSFGEIRKAMKDARYMITFDEIYRWYGSSNGFYTRLDSAAARQALEGRIYNAVQTLPHMKFNGALSVKMFH